MLKFLVLVFCTKQVILQPTVTLEQGVLEGHLKKSYHGKTYMAFEGIPYAKPPVGDLRFEPPQEPDGWTGVLQANVSNYMCLQFLPIPGMPGARGTEDCLFVYVYVPGTEIPVKEKLDVVVHIHGGAYMLGSPGMMAGPDYLMDKNVILVSLNYRLGILGFLSTQDEVVPGNAGLKDQTLALKWIKKNIVKFGGNPESITLTGLSAGGTSVHFHYLSPLSKGLFHRGLSQSGTALQHWALTEEPLKTAQTVAKSLECPVNTTSEMVKCLKTIKDKVLVRAIKKVFVFMNAVPFTPFGPVVEGVFKGSFLQDHPYKLLKTGQVYDAPWITSNVQDEGLIPAGFFMLSGKLKELRERWQEIMPFALDFHETLPKEQWENVLDKITKFYLKEKPISEDNINDLVKMYTDRTYKIDVEKSIRLHAKATKSPVFYYHFTYLLHQPSFFKSVNSKGVVHGDDGRMFVKILLTPERVPEKDEEMIGKMTEFITNFASNSKVSFNGAAWQPVNGSSKLINFLHISAPDSAKMELTEELAPQEFWKSLKLQENDALFPDQ